MQPHGKQLTTPFSLAVLPLLAYCASPPMMISEIADGGNLRQHLAARAWDQALGLRFLLDVSRGMAYLHSVGILHGDLKSANVLVDGSRALVCDFGLSRFRQAGTGTATHGATSHNGGLMGTVGFIAPEMMQGGSLRPPADVFAFAMTCYEVVSRGKYPFQDAPNVMAIFYAVAVEKSRPARPEGVRDDVWALMERCWAHEPAERPRFVEVRDALSGMV
ncbi:kinase-like domain-containing protein [Hyaloraphidium curvatum]|nr:kinase-like domain-containing protein [Hyaloraphidium curvatum]